MGLPERAMGSDGERPVIGVLVTDLDFPYENDFVRGVVDWGESKDVTVVLLPGGPLHSKETRNEIFDLASDQWLDGLMMSPTVGHLVPIAEMRVFCEQFQSLPIVMSASGLEHIPHVRTDSFRGMREVISHLIEAHGRRRIAFIAGPEDDTEADERYEAYAAVLREHDIPVDSALVERGNYVEASGAAAMRQLLARNVDFDAVVGANDAMATGAYAVLRSVGLRVPQDVALAGFDDAPNTQYTAVPLTTARQSFYGLAQQVAETLLDRIEGHSVPVEQISPSSLVVRRSCGCMPDDVVRAAVAATDDAREDPFDLRYKPDAVPVDVWEAFTADMQEAATTPNDMGDSAYLRAIEDGLLALFERRNERARWHQVITEMRRAVIPYLAERDDRFRAENLFQQARVLVAEAYQRLGGAVLEDLRSRASMLRSFDVELGHAQDVEALAPAIESYLPRLGIQQCYLVRYDEDGDDRERLVLAFEQGCTETEARDFSSHQGLLPQDVPQGGLRGAFVVLPFVAEKRLLGYGVVEWGPEDGGGYRRIAEGLSRVFFRLRLLEDANIARRRAEKTLEEVIRTRSIADRLQRAVDTEAVLRITLEELSGILETKTAVARLGTREQLLDERNQLDD